MPASDYGPPVDAEEVLYAEVDTWVCDSDAKAAWAMRQVIRARLAVEQTVADAKAEIDRVEAWRDRSNRRQASTIEFFEAHLTAYALAQRDLSGGKRKTVDTPWGTVSTTFQAARIVVNDEPAYVAWAQIHAPQTLRVTLKPVLGEIRDAVHTTQEGDVLRSGEIVPGLSVEPEKVTARVNPDIPKET